MSEVSYLNRSVKMVFDECCVCGVIHGIPQIMWDSANKRGGRWYCPNGHHIGWDKKDSQSVNDQLRAEKAQLESQLEYERSRVESEKRKTSAAKAKTTKLAKRIANGVCPCCKRSFVNLHRHISKQHPKFIDGENVHVG